MIYGADYHNPAAYNYAQALLNLAKRQRATDELVGEARGLLEVLRRAHGRMRLFLGGPQFSTEEKFAFVDKILGVRIHELLLNLVKLLVRRGRINLIEDVLSIFDTLAAQDQGFREGRLTTAVALNFNQQAALNAALESFLQARLKLEYRVDPDILGGVIFKAGDTQIDTSVSSRLNGLRRQLEEVRVN